MLALTDAGAGLLVAGAILIAFLFLLREGFRDQMPRLTRAAAEGAGVKFEMEYADPAEAIPQLEPGSQELPSEEAEESERELEAAADDDENDADAWPLLIKAGRAKDHEAFERLARVHVSAATDRAEKHRSELRVALARYWTDLEPDAKERFEAAVAASDQQSFAQKLLGIGYQVEGNQTRAEQPLRRAMELSDDDERADAVALLADTLSALGRYDETVDLLRKELSDRPTSAKATGLWRKLAAGYEKLGEKVLATAALEKVTELASNNASAHFKAGYSYGDRGGAFSVGAVHHYEQSLMSDPGTAYANNNMAIQLRSLGLPVQAVRRYRRETGEGEALAKANMASILIEEGFVDEAKVLLGDTPDVPDSDADRVSSVRASLHSAVSSESRKLEEVRSEGQQQVEFMRALASALTDPAWPLPDGAGNSSHDHPKVTFARLTNEDEWSVETEGLGGRRRYVLRPNGNVLQGKHEKFDRMYERWSRVSDAYAYVADDGAIHTMHHEDEKLVFTTFSSSGELSG